MYACIISCVSSSFCEVFTVISKINKFNLKFLNLKNIYKYVIHAFDVTHNAYCEALRYYTTYKNKKNSGCLDWRQVYWWWYYVPLALVWSVSNVY